MTANKNFSRYLVATSITAFGSLLHGIAIMLLVYEWFKSGIILSAFEIASVAPSIALGMLIGHYLQKKDSKAIWIKAAVSAAILEMAVLFYFNIYSLFVLNLFLSIQGIFIMISKNSLLPKIVKEEELSWANNTIFLTILFVGVISPFVCSLLLTISEKAPFVIDVATYLVEATIVYSIYLPEKQQASTDVTEADEGGEKRRFFKDLKLTISALNKEAKIVVYAILLSTSIFFIAGANKLLVVGYIERYFSESYYTYYGIRTAFAAIGMIIIMVPVVFKKIEIKNPYRTCLYSSLFFVIYFLMLGLFVNPYVLIGASLILGVGNGFISPQLNTIYLKYTPEKMLKPVLGLQGTLTSAAQVASIVVTGVLMDFIGIRPIFNAIGLLLLLLFLALFHTRKLETRDKE